MPSRFGVAAIVSFWLATTGTVAYRDLWPHLFAAGPPPIAIDLVDEASQSMPVRWRLVRGDRKVGALTTQMEYVKADDTFLFTHHYRNVQFAVAGLTVEMPDLVETIRLTRAGALREQTLIGRMMALGADARAEIRGTVVDGRLVGRVALTSPFRNFEAPLEPVAVADGPVMNPLQPVNRLARVRPGRPWRVVQVNPLQDAARALAKQLGVPLLHGPAIDLIAQVADEPRDLPGRVGPRPCWVIEYRGAEPVAETWVQVSDGKVLRQEAFGLGERFALEREE